MMVGFDCCHGEPTRQRISEAMVARRQRDDAARELARAVRLFLVNPTTGRSERMDQALLVWEDADVRSALPL